MFRSCLSSGQLFAAYRSPLQCRLRRGTSSTQRAIRPKPLDGGALWIAGKAGRPAFSPRGFSSGRPPDTVKGAGEGVGEDTRAARSKLLFADVMNAVQDGSVPFDLYEQIVNTVEKAQETFARRSQPTRLNVVDPGDPLHTAFADWLHWQSPSVTMTTLTVGKGNNLNDWPLRVKVMTKPDVWDVVDCGTILKPNVAELLRVSKPSSFGLGSETVFDPDVRQAFEISHADLQHNMGFCDADHRFHLHKIQLYPEGGHFKPHVDSVYSAEHTLTGVLLLDVPFEGGDLVVADVNGETSFPPRDTLLDQGCLHFVKFFTNMPHEVKLVTSGVRVALQFNGHSRFPTAAEITEEDGLEYFGEEPICGESDEAVEEGAGRSGTDSVQLMEQLISEVKQRALAEAAEKEAWSLGLLLRHSYGGAPLQQGLFEPSSLHLKGIDAELVRRLQLEPSWQVRLATVVATTDCNAYRRTDMRVASTAAAVPAETPLVWAPGLASNVIWEQERVECFGNEGQEKMRAYHRVAVFVSSGGMKT